jgi:hypothetical protein
MFTTKKMNNNIATSVALGLSVVNSTLLLGHFVYVKQRLDGMQASLTSLRADITAGVDKTMSENMTGLEKTIQTNISTKLNAERDTTALSLEQYETQIAELQDQALEIVRRSNTNTKDLLTFLKENGITNEEHELALKAIQLFEQTPTTITAVPLAPVKPPPRTRPTARPAPVAAQPRRRTVRFQDEEEYDDDYEEEEPAARRRRPAAPAPSAGRSRPAPATPPSPPSTPEGDEENSDNALDLLRARRQQQRMTSQ